MMQRLGKNLGGYLGELINIAEILREVEAIAEGAGWISEIFHTSGGYNWLALRRPPLTNPTHPALRAYISAGVHGDEPAGPLAALRLLRENRWPASAEIFMCPCLNPFGFAANTRATGEGIDLNRDYLHFQAIETRVHVAWLEKRPRFDFSLCLHEDWESHGFYVYEQNPENAPPLAEAIVAGVAKVCPIDQSEIIEDRPASGGIIRPNVDLSSRPQWPEAFWLLANKTRLSCTLEAPSDYPLTTRVDALVAGVNAALESRTV